MKWDRDLRNCGLHYNTYPEWDKQKELLPAHSSQSSVSLYLSGLCEPRKAGHALWPVTAALLGFDSWWFFALAPGHHGRAVPKRKENSLIGYHHHFFASRQKAHKAFILSAQHNGDDRSPKGLWSGGDIDLMLSELLPEDLVSYDQSQLWSPQSTVVFILLALSAVNTNDIRQQTTVEHPLTTTPLQRPGLFCSAPALIHTLSL